VPVRGRPIINTLLACSLGKVGLGIVDNDGVEWGSLDVINLLSHSVF